MTTRTLATRVALAALIVTLMAACSSEPEAPAESSAPAPAGDATVIAVSAVDFAYELSETPTAAGTYTFELTNDGSMGHNLVLEGVDGASTAIIGPGETASFTVTLEAGDHTLFCSVGNHRAQGMEVSFTLS